jgi:hypothetical protein
VVLTSNSHFAVYNTDADAKRDRNLCQQMCSQRNTSTFIFIELRPSNRALWIQNFRARLRSLHISMKFSISNLLITPKIQHLLFKLIVLVTSTPYTFYKQSHNNQIISGSDTTGSETDPSNLTLRRGVSSLRF